MPLTCGTAVSKHAYAPWNASRDRKRISVEPIDGCTRSWNTRCFDGPSVWRPGLLCAGRDSGRGQSSGEHCFFRKGVLDSWDGFKGIGGLSQRVRNSQWPLIQRLVEGRRCPASGDVCCPACFYPPASRYEAIARTVRTEQHSRSSVAVTSMHDTSAVTAVLLQRVS